MDSSNAISNCHMLYKYSHFNPQSSQDKASESNVEISWLYLQWFRRKMNLKTATCNAPVDLKLKISPFINYVQYKHGFAAGMKHTISKVCSAESP